MRLSAAFAVLGRLGSVHASTPVYPTDPEFAGDAAPYLNRIVVLGTDLGLESLRAAVKAYETNERASGTPPFVAVDIDIVAWNSDVLRPADVASRYFRKGMAMLQNAGVAVEL